MNRALAFACFFISVFFLYSCNSSSVWVDDHIDGGIRSDIGKLEKQLVESLSAGDYSKMKDLFSDTLRKTDKGGHFDSLFAQARGRVNLAQFRIKNQFYIKNSAKGKDVSVMSGVDDHSYSLQFKSPNKESFVSVGYFEDSLETLSLVTIYGKYADGWKLNFFHMGILKLVKKDAFDWYQLADVHFKKGDLVDAANDIDLCQRVMFPGNVIWHYKKDSIFISLSQRLATVVGRTYSFPVTINEVSTKPRIFQEFPQIMREGYFPMFLYTTDLPISDTAGLRKECDAIHHVIGNTFQGVDRNNEYIIYRVFGKMPSDTSLGVNYEFVRKTK